MSAAALGATWLLPLDTDVLIQIFKVSDLALPILRLLRQYGIQPAVVGEVEQELAWHAKFKDRFDKSTQKAIGNGTVVRIDRAAIEQQIASVTTDVAAVATGDAYQTLGRDYAKRVGSGEAYTFAAALTLNTPAVSNDFSAVKTLSALGLAVPSPTLRFMDLVVFAHQAGELDFKACNQIRRELIGERESITPRSFQSASFEDALAGFAPRLIDGDRPRVGRARSDSHGHSVERVAKRV